MMIVTKLISVQHWSKGNNANLEWILLNLLAHRRRTQTQKLAQTLPHIIILSGELVSVVKKFAPSYRSQPDALIRIMLYILASDGERYIYDGKVSDDLRLLVSHCIQYSLHHHNKSLHLQYWSKMDPFTYEQE